MLRETFNVVAVCGFKVMGIKGQGWVLNRKSWETVGG